MANLMQRLVRNKSCLSSIQRFTTPSLFTYQKPYIESVLEKSDPVSLLANPVITVSRNESDHSTMRFYPSFPMGYLMNPNMIQFPDLAETASLEEEDANELVIYADSVKKKRKKKMNKHKFRKLRRERKSKK